MMTPGKDIANLANLKMMFGCFLKKLNLPQMPKFHCSMQKFKCLYVWQLCKNFIYPICTAVLSANF